MVPVPAPHLQAVYALLAKLMAPGDFGEVRSCPRCNGQSDLVSPSGGYQCSQCGLAFSDQPIEVDHENGCWTEQMVARLHESIQTSEVVVGALTSIASVAPNVITYDEVLSSTGADRLQLRAELAVLSKESRRLFGRKIWPMSARQGWGGGNQMGYRMPATIARWWLALVVNEQDQ